MNAQVRIQRMLSQSLDVIIHPSDGTFRYYGPRASDSDTLTYVAAAAFVLALIGNLILGGGDVIGLLLSVINMLFQFYLFAGVMYFVGRQLGGMGEFPVVTYTFSLFYVPFMLLSWGVPFVVLWLGVSIVLLWVLPLAFLLVQAFYAYLAIQAAMYFKRRSSAVWTVIAGLVALWVIQQVFRQMTFASL